MAKFRIKKRFYKEEPYYKIDISVVSILEEDGSQRPLWQALNYKIYETIEDAEKEVMRMLELDKEQEHYSKPDLVVRTYG